MRGLGALACVEIKILRRVLLNRRVVLHAIDATPARWRGDAGSSPLDRARTAASSPRNDLVKNSPVHPPHWLISTQVALLGSAYGCDEMVTLYFLATRCDASLAFFAVAWLATQLLQLPSALVRAYTVQSFVGASAAVWKPNSDFEQTQEWRQPRVDGVESTHRRADAVTGTTSRRWREGRET